MKLLSEQIVLEGVRGGGEELEGQHCNVTHTGLKSTVATTSLRIYRLGAKKHRVFTRSLQDLHKIFTGSSQDLYRIFTRSLQDLHKIFTGSLQDLNRSLLS